MRDYIFREYNIKIYRRKTSSMKYHRDEIWANIHNLKTGKSKKVCIWYKDNKGISHDETPNLPAKLRSIVDNAWIESFRKLNNDST